MDLQDHEDSFWHTHTTFTSPKSSQKKALIGIDRAGMLLTDLIYPAIFAYAKLQNNVPLAEQILVFYRMLPACSNHRTLQIMQNYCFSSHRKIFRTSVSQQGLIHLYQSFCARNSFDCKNCILYQSV